MSDTQLNRRDFLQAGSAGVLGLGLAGAMTTRAFGEPQAAGAKPAKAKTVIQIYLEGGMTHIDTLDPKPNASPLVRSFFKPIPTNVPGLEISELLPLLAKQADKYTILRSLTAPGAGHGGYVMLCNAMLPNECSSPHPSAKLTYPTTGCVVGMKKREDGSYQGDIPPWVCIPGIPWGGNNNGFLPPQYQGFCVGDPNNKDFRAPGVSLSPDEMKRLAKRRALMGVVDGGGKAEPPAARAADSLREAAFRLLTGDAKKAFDMSQEKDSVRDRYGRTSFGQGCLLARRLAEYGVPFITVPWGGGDVKGSTGWDMHMEVNKTLKLLCPILDQGISALIEDLAQTGLLEHTIVVFHSESSKSPEWNVKPESLGGKHPGDIGGREHYNNVMATLVAGGGFQAGKVVGESDEEGRYVKSRPIYPWDLWESIYQLIGINPNDKLPNPYGCMAYVSPATACSYQRAGLLTEIM